MKLENITNHLKENNNTELFCALPIFNSEKYLKQTLEKISAQSYKNFILVAVDDGSTDSSSNIFKEFQENNKNFFMLKNTNNLGLNKNWNKCLDICKIINKEFNIPYFCWVADHDLYSVDYFDKLINKIKIDDNNILSYCGSEYINDNGNAITVFNKIKLKKFQTKPICNLIQDFERLINYRVAYGDLIYGIFNFKKNNHNLYFNNILMPDRIAIIKSKLEGNFVFTDETLRFRRVITRSTIERQKKTLFGKNNIPKFLNLHWIIQHFLVFSFYIFSNKKFKIFLKFQILKVYYKGEIKYFFAKKGIKTLRPFIYKFVVFILKVLLIEKKVRKFILETNKIDSIKIKKKLVNIDYYKHLDINEYIEDLNIYLKFAKANPDYKKVNQKFIERLNNYLMESGQEEKLKTIVEIFNNEKKDS